MRMLSPIYSFYPYRGGSGMGHYDVLSRLSKQYDYDITVLTFNIGKPNRTDVVGVKGMKVYRMSCWHPAHMAILPRPSWDNLKVIIHTLFVNKYDIVYTRTRYSPPTMIGTLIGLFRGIPQIHSEVATSHVRSGNKAFDVIGWLLDYTIGKLIVKRATCIGVSNAASDMAKQLGAKKITTVYNGVDRDLFYPPDERPENKKVTVMFVGRLEWLKGIDILNEVAEHFKGSIIIKAFGEGKAEVSTYIARMGQVEHSQIADEMRKADILVLPSRMEGLPRVIQEAMACGLPVIATDVGGTRELVDNFVTGVLVDNTADRFIAHIGYLKDHPELRRRYSQNSIRRAKQYDWDKTVTEYDKQIRRLVDDSNVCSAGDYVGAGVQNRDEKN